MQIKERKNTIINKIVSKVVETKNFSQKMALAGVIALNVGMTNVYAAEELKGKAFDIIDQIVGPILIAVGVLMTIAGGVKLIMAYRQDRPEEQSAAAKDIIIGIAMALAATVLISPLKDIIGV